MMTQEELEELEQLEQSGALDGAFDVMEEANHTGGADGSSGNTDGIDDSLDTSMDDNLDNGSLMALFNQAERGAPVTFKKMQTSKASPVGKDDYDKLQHKTALEEAGMDPLLANITQPLLAKLFAGNEVQESLEGMDTGEGALTEILSTFTGKRAPAKRKDKAASIADRKHKQLINYKGG